MLSLHRQKAITTNFGANFNSQSSKLNLSRYGGRESGCGKVLAERAKVCLIGLRILA